MTNTKQQESAMEGLTPKTTITRECNKENGGARDKNAKLKIGQHLPLFLLCKLCGNGTAEWATANEY